MPGTSAASATTSSSGSASSTTDPPTSHDGQKPRLRILIANERRDRLELVAHAVAALGHEVIAREVVVVVVVEDVGAVTSDTQPDVPLVGLGNSAPHALALIDRIVGEATGPVVVLLNAAAPEFVEEASRRGVFACVGDADVGGWQSAIDLAQAVIVGHRLLPARHGASVIDDETGDG